MDLLKVRKVTHFCLPVHLHPKYPVWTLKASPREPALSGRVGARGLGA